jgi:O-antigen/teichoic acid export membrane protein
MGIVIRQSIKGTLVNYLGVIIGFVTTFFVITAYLTQEEVGLTRVLIDAAILFSSFAQLGTNSSIIRFFPFFKDEDSNHHGFFFWTLIVPLVGFFVFLLVAKCLQGTVIQTFSKNSELFVTYYRFVFPLSLFMLYQGVFEANANVLMRIVVPKFVREVGVRLGLLISYLLYGYWQIIDLDGLVIGICITYFLAAIIDFFYLLTLGRISFKPDFKIFTKPLLKNILFYTLFLLLNAITANVMPLLNTFFLSAGMGLAFTGIYAIANYIATVVEIPNRSLNAIVQPEISETIKNDDFQRTEELCKSVSLHLMLSSALIFFFIWINLDALFLLLPNGEQYEAGKSVVIILGLAKIIGSTLFVGSSALNYSKYYYWSWFFTVLLTGMAITLNVILIPRLGMDGAALSQLISYLIHYICLLALIKVKININIFTLSHLKVLVLLAALVLLNYLCVSFIQPLFYKLPCSPTIAIFTETIVRSTFIMIVSIIGCYKWRISEDINKIIRKVFRLHPTR